MLPIPNLGLAESVILAGGTGLTCCASLIGLAVFGIVMSKRNKKGDRR